jgi:hypothetical protein
LRKIDLLQLEPEDAGRLVDAGGEQGVCGAQGNRENDTQRYEEAMPPEHPREMAQRETIGGGSRIRDSLDPLLVALEREDR